MEKSIVSFNNKKDYIKISHGAILELKNIIENNKCFFVIDKFIYNNYYNLYFKDILKNVSYNQIYLFDCKEENKHIESVLAIIECLSRENYLRDSVLIAIGGGVIGDTAGFVSSIYMRGIRFINVPTTLLAQIDSSIGGKNAINFQKNKNLIGTFKHPEEILIDIDFLNTISKRELLSGLVEIVKYGIVFESEFLDYINDNLENILNLDRKVVQYIILKSCEFKIKVIQEDQYDFSSRKVLNFGHTIGHALESVTEYSLYTHGEAVLIGMFYETCIAYELGIIKKNYFDYILSILGKFKINIDVNIFKSNSFYEALQRDKKNKKDKISFILPEDFSKVSEYMFSLNKIKKINYARYSL